MLSGGKFKTSNNKNRLIIKLKNNMKKDKTIPQLLEDAVMRGYLPSFKILKKENFYTKEPVKILRIALFRKVWFYHLTFRRFL